MYKSINNAYGYNATFRYQPLRTNFQAANANSGCNPYNLPLNHPVKQSHNNKNATSYVQQLSGSSKQASCNTSIDCPLGTKCLNKTCVLERCKTDSSCSSGVCNDNPRNWRTGPHCQKHLCKKNSDCPAGECMNSENYKPDSNGNFYCGRVKKNARISRRLDKIFPDPYWM
jgi:hypothetical protein